MKSANSKLVLVLFDLPFAVERDYDFEALLKNDDQWMDERHVVNALKRLGYKIQLLGLYDSIDPLVATVDHKAPDLVFSLCESFLNNRQYSPHIVGLLELKGIKYTGASPSAMHLCRDKAMTKTLHAAAGTVHRWTRDRCLLLPWFLL